jgi:hypothetical protein
MERRILLAAMAAAGVCALLACVAIQERARRSPSALLALVGPHALYGYYPYPDPYAYDPYYPGYAAGYYGGGYPYYGGYQGYPYSGGYPYYAYDEDNAYQAYAAQEQYRQWADYAAQQQYEDEAAQANYYNYAAANSYKQKHGDVLKVAKKNTNKLVYMGDLEFGGYRHEITGGNDGGYNAPFDINGDGQVNLAPVFASWTRASCGLKCIPPNVRLGCNGPN